ncbi:hypothetical protein [Prochlorothrix hollandica]|nr:hypothetical protein [Prochlorothrix hollandica]
MPKPIDYSQRQTSPGMTVFCVSYPFVSSSHTLGFSLSLSLGDAP